MAEVVVVAIAAGTVEVGVGKDPADTVQAKLLSGQRQLGARTEVAPRRRAVCALRDGRALDDARPARASSIEGRG